MSNVSVASIGLGFLTALAMTFARARGMSLVVLSPNRTWLAGMIGATMIALTPVPYVFAVGIVFSLFVLWFIRPR